VPDLDIISIVLIALSLSPDCFAVAFSGSISMKTISPAQILRTAFAFGGFQTIMPILGWLVGQTVVDFIAGYDHWVAFALLALVGGRMVWEAFRSADDREGTDISRGVLLLALAVATSIDALAVGLTFAFLKTNIWFACSAIGVIAFVATVAGFVSGRKAGVLLGKYAEIIGGVILIGIGIRILVSHLL